MTLASSSLDRLPETLVLWDVDHTLIENGGISKETYALAYELLVGKPPEFQPVTDGRTDFQIMRELLVSNSIDADRYTTISQFEPALREAMVRNSPKLPELGYSLPGALEALKILSTVSTVVQSVLTGNIKENAQAKLHAFALDGLLDLTVGGYGSDDTVRSRLVDAARRKVANKYGRTYDESSTVLIGDTPLDVQAAREGGAKVIAVATGTSSVDSLRRAGADVVLDNLANLDEFISALSEVRIGK